MLHIITSIIQYSSHKIQKITHIKLWISLKISSILFTMPYERHTCTVTARQASIRCPCDLWKWRFTIKNHAAGPASGKHRTKELTLGIIVQYGQTEIMEHVCGHRPLPKPVNPPYVTDFNNIEPVYSTGHGNELPRLGGGCRQGAYRHKDKILISSSPRQNQHAAHYRPGLHPSSAFLTNEIS